MTYYVKLSPSLSTEMILKVLPAIATIPSGHFSEQNELADSRAS